MKGKFRNLTALSGLGLLTKIVFELPWPESIVLFVLAMRKQLPSSCVFCGKIEQIWSGMEHHFDPYPGKISFLWIM